MSEAVTLKAEKREGAGKGAARSLRREGQVPAIIYGGKGDEIRISTGQKELVKEYERGHFTSKVIELEVAGKKERVLPRQIQLHPVTDVPLHVDFMRVTEKTKIVVQVPVRFLNADKSPGIKRGGVLNVVRRDIELLCTAANIPSEIVADLDGMQIGESVHVSSVSIPEGAVPTITDRDFTIATIVGRGAAKAATAEGEEEGDDEEGEEGDATAEGEDGADSEGGEG